MIRKSDQSTGNSVYSSYTLLSGELCFLFTSPYSSKCIVEDHAPPLPDYSIDKHWDFVKTHGLAVRAVGLSVSDAAAAYETSVANGGRGVLPPTRIADTATGTTQLVSEVELYGDVVLRFVSGEYKVRI
jgi:4-hydroxyphenylpyruvate dioxygenase